MKFSVIIPVYNSEKFLEKCVDSILINKADNYEIVLVNDGSTDGSLTLCKELQKKYPMIIVVVDKINGGASSARNVGVEVSRGDYLLFLDSDDYWVEDKCFWALEQSIISKPSVELILLGAYTFNVVSGKQRKRVCFSEDEVNLLGNLSQEEAVEYLLKMNKFPSSAWSVCVKKSFLKSFNLTFKENIIAEDIDWMLGCFYHECVVSAITNMVCLYHEQRVGSVTNTAGEKTVKSLLWITEKWLPILKNEKNYRSKLLSFLAFHYSTIFLAYGSLSYEKRNFYKNNVLRNFNLLDRLNSGKVLFVKIVCKLFGVSYGSVILRKLYGYFLMTK